MSEWAPRRFWTAAEVVEADGGYTVVLDGRAMKTPAKSALVVPTEALASAIATEWQAQEERIDPRTMPLSRMANSAIDKVVHQHAAVVEAVSAYGDADLLCYRADHPADLVARQCAAWDPLLQWAAETLEARLELRTGIMHAPQPAPAISALTGRVAALDPFTLTAFHDLVALSGSLVVGFAALYREREIDALWQVSRLDELWQEEQWGADEDAQAAAAAKARDFADAATFIAALQADRGPEDA
jgi:chaperone required for assembly of F1-ATPase